MTPWLDERHVSGVIISRGYCSLVRAPTTALVTLIAFVFLQHGTGAQQSLTLSLFERNLDQLRQESGIPGLSAAVVQGGQIVKEWGFGFADVERSIAAAPETPYPVTDLTQTFAAALVLQRVDQGYLDLSDPIQRWGTMLPEPGVTVRDVLMHTSTGAYRYDPARFAALTTMLEYYGRAPLRKVIAREILDRFAMLDTVPGRGMELSSATDETLFESDDLDRYAAVERRLAVPYRVDVQRRPTRSEYPAGGMTAATGLVSTVRDLARFDSVLDDHDFISAEMTAAMWAPPGALNGNRVPMGLGWFVQTYNNERILWHFGLAPGAFSSLILKVPGRDLTLILLANSDGLSAPFALSAGDVTTSLFARAFLRVFVP